MSADERQKRDVQLFEELLMACFAMEHHRHRHDAKSTEVIRAFCQRAISDSKYLVWNKTPNDVIKIIKEEKKKESSR